jgi:hypothetical protein
MSEQIVWHVRANYNDKYLGTLCHATLRPRDELLDGTRMCKNCLRVLYRLQRDTERLIKDGEAENVRTDSQKRSQSSTPAD